MERKKDYAVAEIAAFISPSPFRVIPKCPLFPECGGCQWMMIHYRDQLRFKEELIREAFERVANIRTLPLEYATGMEDPWHYRNKVQYPVKRVRGKLLMGYYQEGTHHIVDMEHCPVQLKQFDWITKPLKELLGREPLSVYNERTHRGKLRHVVLRGSERMGETLVVLVMKDYGLSKALAEKIESLDPERIIGVAENINPHRTNVIFGSRTRAVLGRGYYFERVLDRTFRVSTTSFFQVNTLQAERLLLRLRREIEGERYRTILDLYAGVGLFAISLSDLADRVIGVEIAPSSFHDAQDNILRNDVTHVEYFQGRAEDYVDAVGPYDLLVVDPPRQGLDQAVIEGIGRARPREIAYVSCNPVTLARDSRALIDMGYDLVFLAPFDFFPHTYHIETLAFFRLKRTGP